jgi:hypothetical protein
MDAVKILGSLISNNAMGSSTVGNILGALIGEGEPQAPPQEANYEAQYFGNLANGLGMDGDTCNRIHEQHGQPKVFA